MAESGDNEAGVGSSSGIKDIFDILKHPDKLGKERVKELYDRWSLNYDKDVQTVNFYPYIKAGIVLAEHCLDKSVTILDCGAGTGLVGEQLHSLGYTNIVGLDISQNSLNVAEKKGVYKKLVCGEVGEERMPFTDVAALLLLTSVQHAFQNGSVSSNQTEWDRLETDLHFHSDEGGVTPPHTPNVL